MKRDGEVQGYVFYWISWPGYEERRECGLGGFRPMKDGEGGLGGFRPMKDGGVWSRWGN